MKKEYIKPTSAVIKVDAASIMALSQGNDRISGETKYDYEDADYGRNDNQTSRPNVWEQGW